MCTSLRIAVQSIAETLQTDVGKAVKVAFDKLEGSEYRTRDTSISNLNKYNTIELSLLLCDDNFIRELNKEWRDVDHATDVLSMSQHIPGLDIPIVWHPTESVYQSICFGCLSFNLFLYMFYFALTAAVG